RRRLANDNNAYVAFYKNQPAAFGWSSSGKAVIGELSHELILPLGHKYLWNFRTIDNFRGLGIYPQLLQHIVRSEGHTTERFWILHAPENTSSQKGILKAGFKFISEVSVKNLDQVIVSNHTFHYSAELHAMGFSPSGEPHATCWTCSSPYLSHKKTGCCCTTSGKLCNEKQFLSA
ncbi:MAG TPA: hypothetical protein VGD31_14680, partial [Sphingobacteriaceae bacterium]